MKVVISAEGHGQASDMQALYEWLVADSALGGKKVTVTAIQQVPGGQMGVGCDEIQVILGAATLVLELANSLRSWLKTRQGTSRMTIMVDDPQLAERLSEQLGATTHVSHSPDLSGDGTSGSAETL